MLKIKRYNKLNESEENATVIISDRVMANVRDMADRRHYDKEWAKSIQPLPKMSSEELVQRYYAALFLFDVREFPKCVADVARIGIFQNYMFKLFDNGFTSVQLQNMSDAYFKYFEDKFQKRKHYDVSNNQQQPQQSNSKSNSIVEKIKAMSPEDRKKQFDALFDSKNNKKRVENFPNSLKLESNGNISMIVDIKDESTDESEKIKLTAKSFGDLMFKFGVLLLASVVDVHYYFSINSEIKKVGYKVFYTFLNHFDDFNDWLEKFDSKTDEMFEKVFEDTKSLDELLDKLKKFKF